MSRANQARIGSTTLTNRLNFLGAYRKDEVVSPICAELALHTEPRVHLICKMRQGGASQEVRGINHPEVELWLANLRLEELRARAAGAQLAHKASRSRPCRHPVEVARRFACVARHLLGRGRGRGAVAP